MNALINNKHGYKQIVSNQGQINQYLSMNLTSQSVKGKLKFKTQIQVFDNNYKKLDHLQRHFHEIAINHYVKVITNKYEQSPRPLAIVDIACGYGRPTLAIREKLLSNKVQISKIVGYDVSGEMINYASNNNIFPQVSFRKANAQTQFDDEDQYDVAICLFGLHWMNDVQKVIARIHKSLKAGGLLLTLTPIQIRDLFDYRTNFVNNSNWSREFSEQGKLLRPFHFNKDNYLTPLSKYFKTLNEMKKETKLSYSRQEFLRFLQSWLPEVRHITKEIDNKMEKEAISYAYLSDFIDSIDKNKQGNVYIHQDGSVIFTQHTFEYEGEKQ